MAKLTLATIQGAYASTTELNANFDAIEAAIELLLSRDGTTPNQMSADLDMNSNDLLNVENIYANTLVYNGEAVSAAGVILVDTAGHYTVDEVESALAETAVRHDTQDTAQGVQDTAISLNTAKVTDSFDTKLVGYAGTGFHSTYAADLDSIDANSRYDFIASGVTNEPSDMVSTEYGIVETMVRSTTNALQNVYGQSGTAVGKVWTRENTAGTWGSWRRTDSQVVQHVYTNYSEVATGTTTMPLDDTIPQITEGTEFMSQTITPSNASNILRIQLAASISPSIVNWVENALFQDSTADAIAATIFREQATWSHPFIMDFWMVAGTTSATTFSYRAGPHSATTLTFNGNSASRFMGGVASSSISIIEYKV
jgi:hypothetical protein